VGPVTGRTIRTALCISGIFLLTGCGLTSCGSGDNGPPGFTQTVKGENGSESSVRFGKDAVIPPDFPSGVPLPEAGALRAVVAEKNPPNASYTMTYAMGGRDGNVLGNHYRQKLENAGFKIEHYSSVGGTDNQITQFDAVGRKWDVAVVSGKASPRDRATFSVQVHTHGQITSGIGGIGDTTPDVLVPKGSGVEIPNPDPGASGTTSTTSGF